MSAYQFKLFQIRRRGVVGLNERSAVIKNGTDDEAQREHITEDAARGLHLDLGGCRGGKEDDSTIDNVERRRISRRKGKTIFLRTHKVEIRLHHLGVSTSPRRARNRLAGISLIDILCCVVLNQRTNGRKQVAINR